MAFAADALFFVSLVRHKPVRGQIHKRPSAMSPEHDATGQQKQNGKIIAPCQ
jgi:hypothetical protein